MMEEKQDRRTRYTKAVIKDALLRLKRTKDYNAITIAELCRTAEISRGTFYLHYRGISEVLDAVIEDACSQFKSLPEHLELLPQSGDTCAYPFCQYLRENEKYRCIFFDDALTTRIVERLALDSGRTFLEQMQTTLTPEQIETLLYFQLSGCLAVAKRSGTQSAQQWCGIQSTIDSFLKAGFSNAFSEGSLSD